MSASSFKACCRGPAETLISNNVFALVASVEHRANCGNVAVNKGTSTQRMAPCSLEPPIRGISVSDYDTICATGGQLRVMLVNPANFELQRSSQRSQ